MRNKKIVDREMVNTLSEGCPACGRKFTMGETVVMACGDWEGGPKFIHENEAVYNPEKNCYFERKFYEAEKEGKKQL